MKRLVLGIVFGIFSFACVWAASPNSSVVMTAYGAVAGQLDAATHVISFKGVPFAAPPVGKLRWRAPQPPASWKGVRDGSRFGPNCMQTVHGDLLPWTKEFLVQGSVSEDCLYLNVWTPQAEKRANLPVIVYIPGGAFMEGSGSVPIYNGTNLAHTGLVVVTINYRLGVFGFFTHPELTAESPHHSSGNYGLLDQIAALRWVKANIRGFGGDPNRVTVWGQSAGAFSVGDLLISPLASGLFERAIADSGLGLAIFPMLDLHSAEAAGARFATDLHAANLEQLRAIRVEELLKQNQFARWVPIVDGWVIPKAPNEANQEIVGNEIPVMTGYQANDGKLFSMAVHSTVDYEKVVQHLYGTMAGEFERLYPGQSLDEMDRSLAESASDRDRVSMFLWAAERFRRHRGPVYTYFFDRAIPWPQHPEFGAFHSGELPYFFLNLYVLDRPWEPVDHDIARIASSYLRNFARNGNPNTPGLPEWQAVNPSSMTTMEIGAKMGAMQLANKQKYAFWVRYFRSPKSRNAPVF